MKKTIRENGTIDIWVNKDGYEGKILITYNGNDIEQGFNSWDLNNINNAEKLLDEMLGVLGRDIENWHTYNVIIHWGVHNWRFTNDYNIID